MFFKSAGISCFTLYYLLLPSSLALERLSIEEAIQKANTKNPDAKEQRLNLRTAELDFKDAWRTMYLPTVSLDVSSSSNFTLAQIGGTEAAREGTRNFGHGYPSSSVSLNLGSYTIFNFWRDQITYDISRLNYDRTKEQNQEFKRSLRFDIIRAYFRLKTSREKLLAAKRSVDIATAIVQLLKSRKRLGKANESDVSSAEVDLLSAKNEYNFSSTTVENDLWNLNLLLGDPVGTNYQLITPLKYRRLSLSTKEALITFMKNAPGMKDARLALKTSELSVELEEKNILPLPKVSISGLTLSYSDRIYSTSSSVGTTASTASGNIDVSTSISLSWPLFGPGGLFNRERLERARISKNLSDVRLDRQKVNGRIQVFSSIASIREREERVENLKKSFQATAKMLDSFLEDLANQKISRLELRDAIREARQNDFNLKDAILSHLETKLSLSQIIGLDRLPGDPY